MSMQLQARVSALEATVKELRQHISDLVALMAAEPEHKPNPNGPRQMCPKCGEKPNYHLHVIHCKGPTKRAAV